MFSYPKTILETDIDMYGHVNNAKYLNYFEEARWDIVTEKGFGYQRIMEEKIGPVILRVDMQYLKELRARDKITIHTEFTSPPAKIMTLTQTIKKEDGTIACIADFTYAVWSLEKRKIIHPPQHWLEATGMI